MVRHGQARSFQKEHPLTPVGEQQAARLACWWLRHGVRFDEVHSGTLARQVRTEQVVAQTFRDAGESWPEAQRDSAWNEYDAASVLACDAPATDDPRAFFKRLEAAMTLWLDGAIASPYIEPWPTFRDRVSGALVGLMAGPPGRHVAVFTSGGVIGYVVHRAMQSPERTFLDVNWRVRNASLSHFLFDRDRLTLDSFNTIAHLQDETLWTYR